MTYANFSNWPFPNIVSHFIISNIDLDVNVHWLCTEAVPIKSCTGWRYGCCQDGKTQALGINFAGCPGKYLFIVLCLFYNPNLNFTSTSASTLL
jgi:hypothetical protein